MALVPISVSMVPPCGRASSIRNLMWLLVHGLVLMTLISANNAISDSNDNDLTVCEAPSPALDPFVDEITFPRYISLSSENPNITLGAFRISQKVHRDLPNTTLYAFGTTLQTASFPGPTLLAQVGTPAYVRWENHIEDASHLLGTDNAIPWANPSQGGVPIVAHLHGAQVESPSDGHPNAWFTHLNETGETYVKQDYTYHNQQSATMLWYHDHTHGITRLNLFAGLMGMYILGEGGAPSSPSASSYYNNNNNNNHNNHNNDDDDNDNDEEQELPIGLPLLIRDWKFSENGSLNFPLYGTSGTTLRWCAEYGDVMVVNGVATPYLRVLPRTYRFRLLNGCNARFLELSLSHPFLYFLQIGGDGGTFLPRARNLTTLLFAPGERVDALIDFSAMEDGAEIIVINTGPAPFPTGKLSYSTNGTFYVMKFLVDSSHGILEGVVNDTLIGRIEEAARSMVDMVPRLGFRTMSRHSAQRSSMPGLGFESTSRDGDSSSERRRRRRVRHRNADLVPQSSSPQRRKHRSMRAHLGFPSNIDAISSSSSSSSSSSAYDRTSQISELQRKYMFLPSQLSESVPRTPFLSEISSVSKPLAELGTIIASEAQQTAMFIDRSTSKNDIRMDQNITVRGFTMRSFQGLHGEPNHLLLNNKSWTDPITDFPTVGSTEIWELINLGADAHNMHIHLVHFKVINQQSFSSIDYEAERCALDLPYPHPDSCFTEEPQIPEYSSYAWKDTVIAWPGNVTRLLLRFTSMDGSSFPFDPTLEPGYLWHCHTGDHEDYEMMRPFQLRF